MDEVILTQRELKRILRYNKETGLFTRKIATCNSVKVGDIAGFIQPSGYVSICIKGKEYRAHRLAFLYVLGYFPENLIDHKDRVRHNNKWGNLRESSKSCNINNTRIWSNNTSGIKGVAWKKPRNKWRAYITINFKTISLGNFVNIKDAAEARYNAEIKFGFPDCDINSTAKQYLDSLQS